MCISVAVNVISNYVTKFFAGIGGDNKVKLDVIAEITQDREYKRLHYEGPPDGLSRLAEVARSVFHEK